MNNFRQESHKPVTLTAPAAVVSGEPLVIGGLFVVPQISADSGDPFTALTEGVFVLAKVTGTAFSEGDPAYWDVADEEVNDDSAGNNCIGHFLKDAASNDTTALVRVIPTPIATTAALDTRLD